MGRSSDLGIRWARTSARPVGRARDHHGATGGQPVDGRLGHLGGRDPHELGSDVAASSSERPDASANPVSTGPGHSVVTVTPVPFNSTPKRPAVGQDERLGRRRTRPGRARVGRPRSTPC